MAPPVPTAHTSFGPEPHTPRSALVIPPSPPLGTSAHMVPRQCRIVPASPTAQTSSTALPQTSRRSIETPPVGTACHAVPFNSASVVPPPPTIQPAAGPDVHAPRSHLAVGLSLIAQPPESAPPSRVIVPPVPTAHPAP